MEQTDRILTIDGLRGLCACAMVIYHGLQFLDIAHIGIDSGYITLHRGIQLFIAQILLAIFNGSAAVMFFFVILGYVLGKSLGRSGGFIQF